MEALLLEKIARLEAENKEIKSLLLELCHHFNIGQKPRQNVIDLKARAKKRAIEIQSKYEHKAKK